MANKIILCTVRFRLGDILRERGMTQTDASIQTNLSRQALVKLTNNPRAVQMETLGKLCTGLGLSPSELFEAVEEILKREG